MSNEPLKDSDIKPGMLVRAGSVGSDIIWTVLDKAPQPGHWWLHRTDEVTGEWKATSYHRYEIGLVSNGDREPQQLALV